MRDKRREKCRNHKQHEDGGKSNGESTFLGVIQWANRFYVNFIFSAQRRGKTIMRIFAKHYSQHPKKKKNNKGWFGVLWRYHRVHDNKQRPQGTGFSTVRWYRSSTPHQSQGHSNNGTSHQPHQQWHFPSLCSFACGSTSI